jgi:hypothetical protein
MYQTQFRSRTVIPMTRSFDEVDGGRQYLDSTFGERFVEKAG